MNYGHYDGIEDVSFGAERGPRGNADSNVTPIRRPAPSNRKPSAGSTFATKFGEGLLDVGKSVALDKLVSKPQAPVTNVYKNEGFNKKYLVLGGIAAAVALAFYFMNKQSGPEVRVTE